MSVRQTYSRFDTPSPKLNELSFFADIELLTWSHTERTLPGADIEKYTTADGDRTRDLSITCRLLYHLSYHGAYT